MGHNDLSVEMAIEMLANDSFFLTPRGRKACLDALTTLFLTVGASDRVKQSDGPTGQRIVCATLGHFALIVTKVRNVLEISAGTRLSSRGGAIGDGHFPQWVAEIRRSVPTQPEDAEPHDGLVLVDGGDAARSLPQCYCLADSWVSSVPSAGVVLPVWVMHCVRFGCFFLPWRSDFPPTLPWRRHGPSRRRLFLCPNFGARCFGARQRPAAPRIPPASRYPTAPRYPATPRYPAAPRYAAAPRCPAAPRCRSAPRCPAAPLCPAAPRCPPAPAAQKKKKSARGARRPAPAACRAAPRALCPAPRQKMSGCAVSAVQRYH